MSSKARPAHRFLVLIIAAFLATSEAIAGALPSLRDLYLDIPQQYLPIVSGAGKPLTRDERAKLIKVEDEANGYLEAGGGDTDSFESAQVALFRKKGGGFLVGLRAQFGDTTSRILMLTKSGETWADVTKEVLPAITEDMVTRRAQELIPAFKKNGTKLMDSASGTYAYVLPRKGTTIEVVVQSDAYDGKERVVLWRLPFDGERFTLTTSSAPKK